MQDKNGWTKSKVFCPGKDLYSSYLFTNFLIQREIFFIADDQINYLFGVYSELAINMLNQFWTLKKLR